MLVSKMELIYYMKIHVCNSGIVNKLTPKYIIVSDSGKYNNLGHELFLHVLI